MRADIATAAALHISRNKAGELIRAGLVAFDGAVLVKPSQELDLGADLGTDFMGAAGAGLNSNFGTAGADFGSRFALLGEFFVSRAALKLKAFLEECDSEFGGENSAQTPPNSNLAGGGGSGADLNLYDSERADFCGGGGANSNLAGGAGGESDKNGASGANAATFAIDARDKVVLDVGASTGGFTQIWLARGAKSVVALDVGSAQLHASLRGDSRVIVRENCDVRDFYPSFSAGDFGENLAQNPPKNPQNPAPNSSNSNLANPARNPAQNPQNPAPNSPQISPQTPPQNPAFDIVSADVSFISLALVLPHLARLCAGDLVVLFKPQFEVGVRARRGKSGVVRDPRATLAALAGFEARARALGLVVRRKARSAVAGKEGNFEWFFWLQKRENQGQK